MQKLGQHFLKNPSVIKKIITETDIKKGETIIEIGPGHGELTIPLAEACEKVGANIIAIEKDKRLGDSLQVAGSRNDFNSLKIVNGDVLKLLPSIACDLRPATYKIVGNIPYYITGYLFRTIGDLEIKPELCIFTIQKEVAERICAIPPKMNRLAASVQFWAEPKIIAQVPKTDFLPAPKVDSAVIKLEVRAKRYEVRSEQYYSTVRMLFAQPRKTILNNLSVSYELGAMRYEADKIKTIEKLKKIGLDPALRPQNLTIKDILAIISGS